MAIGVEYQHLWRIELRLVLPRSAVRMAFPVLVLDGEVGHRPWRHLHSTGGTGAGSREMNLIHGGPEEVDARFEERPRAPIDDMIVAALDLFLPWRRFQAA